MRRGPGFYEVYDPCGRLVFLMSGEVQVLCDFEPSGGGPALVSHGPGRRKVQIYGSGGVVHRRKGAAVVLEQGGAPQEEYYFLHGTHVDRAGSTARSGSPLPEPAAALVGYFEAFEGQDPAAAPSDSEIFSMLERGQPRRGVSEAARRLLNAWNAAFPAD